VQLNFKIRIRNLQSIFLIQFIVEFRKILHLELYIICQFLFINLQLTLYFIIFIIQVQLFLVCYRVLILIKHLVSYILPSIYTFLNSNIKIPLSSILGSKYDNLQDHLIKLLCPIYKLFSSQIRAPSHDHTNLI
jgi:hypothetical protein